MREPSKELTKRINGKLKAIIVAFKKTNSPTLDLTNQDVGNAQITVLAKTLPKHSSLTELNIRYNEICDEGSILLATLIPKYTALQRLLLRHNRISDLGAKALWAALTRCKTVVFINLSDNKMTDESIKDLINTVPHFPASLTTIDISENSFTDLGATLLLSAIPTFPRPLTIVLENRYRSDDGADMSPQLIQQVASACAEHARKLTVGSAPPISTQTLQRFQQLPPQQPPPRQLPTLSLKASAPPAGIQTAQQLYLPPQPLPAVPPIGNRTLQFIAAGARPAPSAPPNVSVSLSEIKLNNHEIIGRGGFGVVYRARWGERMVAVKATLDNNNGDALQKEYEDLKLLKPHPHIINIHGYFIRENTGCCLIMDYYPKGSLNKYLYPPVNPGDTAWNIPDTWPLRWGLEISEGLDFLHKNKILHLDLKPENVLVCENWHIVITDFGLSRKLAADQTHQTTLTAAGTPAFTAPEIFANSEDGKTRYDSSNDLYSFAMVLWCCVAQKYPFYGWAALKIMNEVANNGFRPEIPKKTPVKLAKLITGCWDARPAKRPTAQQAHEALTEIYKEESRNFNPNLLPTKK